VPQETTLGSNKDYLYLATPPHRDVRLVLRINRQDGEQLECIAKKTKLPAERLRACDIMEQAQLLMKGSASAAVRHRSFRYRTSMDITPQATNTSIDLSIMGQLKWRLRRRKNVSNQGTMIINGMKILQSIARYVNRASVVRCKSTPKLQFKRRRTYAKKKRERPQ
jgi:hypothetical protein